MNLFSLMAKITLDDKSFQDGIDISTKSGSNFASKMKTFGGGAIKAVGAISVAVGGALTAVAGFSVKSAMELEASEAKYNTVFEGMTDQADDFIKKFQQLTPATTAEARNMASGIQDMLVPLGFMRDEATNMTGEFMHVAGALANFNSGTETAQSVIDKVTAALTGEYSGLKALGVQLDVNTVKQKAVEMGLASTTQEVDKQMQAQVLLSEIYAQSGDALAAYNEESLDAKTKFALLKSEIVDVSAQMGSKFLPMINEGLGALRNGFRDAIPYIEGFADGILGMIQGTEGASEQFKTNLTNLMNGLLNNLISMLPKFIEIALQIVMSVVDTILSNLPMLLDAGIQALMSVVGGISQTLPELIPVAVNAVLNLINTIIDNLDLIVDTGIEMLFSLADGLINALPGLIEKAPFIIEKLINALVDNFPKIVQNGIDLLLKLVEGVIKSIPNLVRAVPQIISSLIDGFVGYYSSMWDIGKNLVEGIWNGISNAASWLKDKISGFASGVVDSVKGFFGIHSPSRVMAKEVGKYLPQGIAVGVDDEMDNVNADIEKSLNSIVDLNGPDIPTQDNGIGTVIRLLQQLLSKDINIEIDGREVMRATAEYQNEYDEYNSRNPIFA